jgi:hypothetical protein
MAGILLTRSCNGHDLPAILRDGGEDMDAILLDKGNDMDIVLRDGTARHSPCTPGSEMDN